MSTQLRTYSYRFLTYVYYQVSYIIKNLDNSSFNNGIPGEINISFTRNK